MQARLFSMVLPKVFHIIRHVKNDNVCIHIGINRNCVLLEVMARNRDIMPQAPLDPSVATGFQHICKPPKAHSCQEEGKILSRCIFSLRFQLKTVLSFLPSKPPPALHTHTDSSLHEPRVSNSQFKYQESHSFTFPSKPWLVIIRRNDNLPVSQEIL